MHLVNRLLATLFCVLPAIVSEGLAEEAGYLGSERCAACHAEAFDAWEDSHHAWALSEAVEARVLGDFDDARLSHAGATHRFFRDGGRYFVEIEERDGSRDRHEILYSVGVDPLQQYLIELPGGRLQVLDIAWDSRDEAWFPLFPDHHAAPGDGLHWSGPYKSWQAQCAVCHQTGLVKGYQPRDGSYRSSWQELSVGCESCHGPGETHVAWAEAGALGDAPAWSGVEPLSYLDRKARAEAEIDLCGGCHSRRQALDPDSPPPGSGYHDHHSLALLRDGLYFPDGQILDEVYVLGSFLQSKMHRQGVTCGDCHQPHSLTLVAEGNALCTQCHNPAGQSAFPEMPRADYDSAGHHHHAEGSAGARCVACHMPARSYMQVDPRRDHRFGVPRPDLSLALGTPNACTQCHDDRDDAWAADRLKAWFPEGRQGEAHFAEALDAGRRGDSATLRHDLLELAHDRDAAALVRATAASQLAGKQMEDAEIERLAALLEDASPLVRRGAIEGLAKLPRDRRYALLLPLIADPVRSVRQAASLATFDLPVTSADLQSQLAARKDLQQSILGRFDQPGTHLQMAGLAMAGRNWQAAEAALAAAVSLDPQLVEAWQLRIELALAQGKDDQAAALRREARSANPGREDLFADPH